MALRILIRGAGDLATGVAAELKEQHQPYGAFSAVKVEAEILQQMQLCQ